MARASSRRPPAQAPIGATAGAVVGAMMAGPVGAVIGAPLGVLASRQVNVGAATKEA